MKGLQTHERTGSLVIEETLRHYYFSPNGWAKIKKSKIVKVLVRV